jgi:hypothetical protein
MRLIAATFSVLLALALGTVAVPLAVWTAMVSYRAEWMSGWTLWALERSPLPLYAAPVRVATDMMQRDFLLAASLAAVVLCLLAFSALRSAQRALRPAEASHDGKATIELKTQALRVGRPVEGSIWLAQRPGEGELYRVHLSCSRGHGPGKSDRAETAYWEELEVAPVPTPVGWSLPFRFVVPPIAPPSGVTRFMSGPGYHWRLAVQRAQGWMSFPSVFALHLAPAPAEELRALDRAEPGRREPALKPEADSAARKAAPVRERTELRERVFLDDTRASDTVAKSRSASVSADGSRAGAGIGGNGGVGHASHRAPIPRAAEGQIPEGRLTTAAQGPQFIGDAIRVRREGSPPTIASEVRSPEIHRDPSSTPRRAPNSFGDVTPGDTQARDTLVHNLAAGISERAAGGTTATGANQLNEGIAWRPRMDPPLHERPEFRDESPYDHEAARGEPGVLVKIVKWLFLVLFGGALAVSAVAFVTAVLLGYVL